MKDYTRREFMAIVAGASLLAGCGSSSQEIIASPPTVDTAFDPTTSSALDSALTQVYRTSRAPGIIAGVWRGSRAWTATRGTTTINGTQSPTTDSYTRIGSITKTLTGTIILQLIQEGRLSFESTLDQWYPDIEGSNAITIRDLGSMSSGLDSYTDDDNIVNDYFSDPTQIWDPEQLLYAGAALERTFAPGQGFLYCNTNLVALGLIAEKILQQPLALSLDQRIFRPLGMTDSSYPSTSTIPNPHWQGYTLQSSTDGVPIDSTDWSPTFAAGAGQALSRLQDLAVWAKALGTGSLLSPAIQAERLRLNPFSVAGVRAYAFAAGVDNDWVAHDGVLPGFNSQIAYLPALDTTIVVMANTEIPDDQGRSPAPKAFTALATVVAPDNIP